MKRLLMVGTAVAGVALFGTGLSGVANVDSRLSDAADRPAAPVHIDVRQETRTPGDCPWREHREEAPLRDELRL
jgi:hypothetical protein